MENSKFTLKQIQDFFDPQQNFGIDDTNIPMFYMFHFYADTKEKLISVIPEFENSGFKCSEIKTCNTAPLTWKMDIEKEATHNVDSFYSEVNSWIAFAGEKGIEFSGYSRGGQSHIQTKK